jgi:hypothetical protein
VGGRLYVRVMPASQTDPFSVMEAADLIHRHNVGPLRLIGRGDYSHGRNRYGGIVYTHIPEDSLVVSSTQLFRSKEIWGVDWWTLRNRRDDGAPYIPGEAYEKVLASGLNRFLEFAQKQLGLKAPLVVEAGGAGLQGYYMAVEQHDYIGPIHDDVVYVREKLMDCSTDDVNQFLLALFRKFFDACAAKRPEHFNGFPPRPG